MRVRDIRVRLEFANSTEDLALFNMVVESKLRAVQLLVGLTNLDSTTRYLDVDQKDTLSIYESVQF